MDREDSGKESRLKETLLMYVGYVASIPLSIFAGFDTSNELFEQRGLFRKIWDNYKYFSGLDSHFSE